MSRLFKTLLVATLLFVPVQAFSAVYIYNISNTFSGATPQGPIPWLTATFTDVGANQVQLDMTAPGLTGQEFVGAWFFNFSPLGNLSDLSISRLSSPNPGTTTVTTDLNNLSAGGGGLFDIGFNFPQSLSDGRFTSGLSTSYLISSVSSLDASMFNYPSLPRGGNGTWLTAAHIQGVGSDASLSGWVGTPVPEPTTYLMLGSLLGLVAFAKWRHKAKVS